MLFLVSQPIEILFFSFDYPVVIVVEKNNRISRPWRITVRLVCSPANPSQALSRFPSMLS
jgi:hypothetical protein